MTSGKIANQVIGSLGGLNMPSLGKNYSAYSEAEGQYDYGQDRNNISLEQSDLHERENSYNIKQPSRHVSGLRNDMNTSPKDTGIYSRNMNMVSNGRM
jgi:hypothetical protein